jgi:L-aspartate oxidase
LECDYLVIGSGIAGLSYSIRVAEFGTVVVVTKKQAADSATNLAQGGIAAVLDPDDSIEAHVRDTTMAGDGLCSQQVVRDVVSAGRERVEDLIQIGVEFVESTESNGLSLGREGGHSCRRVAHSYDLTGRAIEQALLARVREHANITVLEDCMAVDLLISRDESELQCFGAYIMPESGVVYPIKSDITVISTGGAGKVYLYTSNPDIATGDGVAMAYRAGADIANMEFVQFHPTCLFHPSAKNFLISEAVRGEGAVLIDKSGKRFMNKYSREGELATRDRVALSIDKELKESGEQCVYLDISHKNAPFIRQRFPSIYEMCLSYNIDITCDPIPVVPAAHYMCGGILVDQWGNTTIGGLMALGEASCTGLHGANRLASNSLLEAVVYAEKAARYCAENRLNNPKRGIKPDEWTVGQAEPLTEAVLINHNWDAIRRTMWNYVGIVRNVKRLTLAQQRIRQISHDIDVLYRSHHVNQDLIELRNISHVALMIVHSALLRKESRGLHYCLDFPEKDKHEKYWTVLTRSKPSEAAYFDSRKLVLEAE